MSSPRNTPRGGGTPRGREGICQVLVPLVRLCELQTNSADGAPTSDGATEGKVGMLERQQDLILRASEQRFRSIELSIDRLFFLIHAECEKANAAHSQTERRCRELRTGVESLREEVLHLYKAGSTLSTALNQLQEESQAQVAKCLSTMNKQTEGLQGQITERFAELAEQTKAWQAATLAQVSEKMLLAEQQCKESRDEGAKCRSTLNTHVEGLQEQITARFAELEELAKASQSVSLAEVSDKMGLVEQKLKVSEAALFEQIADLAQRQQELLPKSLWERSQAAHQETWEESSGRCLAELQQLAKANEVMADRLVQLEKAREASDSISDRVSALEKSDHQEPAEPLAERLSQMESRLSALTASTSVEESFADLVERVNMLSKRLEEAGGQAGQDASALQHQASAARIEEVSSRLQELGQQQEASQGAMLAQSNALAKQQEEVQENVAGWVQQLETQVTDQLRALEQQQEVSHASFAAQFSSLEMRQEATHAALVEQVSLLSKRVEDSSQSGQQEAPSGTEEPGALVAGQVSALEQQAKAFAVKIEEVVAQLRGLEEQNEASRAALSAQSSVLAEQQESAGEQLTRCLLELEGQVEVSKQLGERISHLFQVSEQLRELEQRHEVGHSSLAAQFSELEMRQEAIRAQISKDTQALGEQMVSCLLELKKYSKASDMFTARLRKLESAVEAGDQMHAFEKQHEVQHTSLAARLGDLEVQQQETRDHFAKSLLTHSKAFHQLEESLEAHAVQLAECFEKLQDSKDLDQQVTALQEQLKAFDTLNFPEVADRIRVLEKHCEATCAAFVAQVKDASPRREVEPCLSQGEEPLNAENLAPLLGKALESVELSPQLQQWIEGRLRDMIAHTGPSMAAEHCKHEVESCADTNIPGPQDTNMHEWVMASEESAEAEHPSASPSLSLQGGATGHHDPQDPVRADESHRYGRAEVNMGKHVLVLVLFVAVGFMMFRTFTQVGLAAEAAQGASDEASEMSNQCLPSSSGCQPGQSSSAKPLGPVPVIEKASLPPFAIATICCLLAIELLYSVVAPHAA